MRRASNDQREHLIDLAYLARNRAEIATQCHIDTMNFLTAKSRTQAIQRNLTTQRKKQERANKK